MLLFLPLQISLNNQIVLVTGTFDLLTCSKTVNSNDSYRHLLSVNYIWSLITTLKAKNTRNRKITCINPSFTAK